MSAPATLTRPGPPRGRPVELVLAHMHLRLGALALARVELETMAGLGFLDTPGLVDLAEVRWRTGDLLGAGEAASAALRGAQDDPVALVVAAEAAAALGRPTEARRLASRVIEGSPTSIDAIFAGMPRSGMWPDDVAEPPPTAPTLFDREPEQPGRVDTGESHGQVPVPTERTRSGSPTSPVALGFWDGEAGIGSGSVPLPDPALELEAGRAALVAGALDEAAIRFGLALRLAPALAPAVLEATDGARTANLMMVRGDAFRLAGHETEARQAYAIAAQGGLPERRQHPRTGGNVPDTAEAETPAAEGPAPTAVTEPGEHDVETMDEGFSAEATEAEVPDVDASLAETATKAETVAEPETDAGTDEAVALVAAVESDPAVAQDPAIRPDAAAGPDPAIEPDALVALIEPDAATGPSPEA